MKCRDFQLVFDGIGEATGNYFQRLCRRRES